MHLVLLLSRIAGELKFRGLMAAQAPGDAPHWINNKVKLHRQEQPCFKNISFTRRLSFTSMSISPCHQWRALVTDLNYTKKDQQQL
jgi:hypothetical protein